MKERHAACGGRRQIGVTLTELMFVVAIILIIGSLAVPSYLNRMERVRRNDARMTLLDVAKEQEKFFLDNGAYTANIADLAISTLPNTTDHSPRGYYLITLNATGTQFTATAAPTAGSPQQNDANCASFAIDEKGARTATGAATSPDTHCWAR